MSSPPAGAPRLTSAGGDTPPGPAPGQRSGGSRLTLAVLLAAPALAQADATIVNNLVPAILRDLHASPVQGQFVVGAYLFAYAVLLITCARLGDTHGFHRLLTAGITVFGVASLACALAPTPAVLVGARGLQGIGAAMMAPQTLTGIQLLFPGPARARALGWYSVAVAGGAVTGQIAGGLLVASDAAGIGWRAAFLLNVPLCGVLALTAARVLPRRGHPAKGTTAARPQPLDVPGVATLSATLLLVLVPLSLGPASAWPTWTLFALAASPLAGWSFLRSQRTDGTRRPLVNTSALRHRPIVAGLLALLLAGGTYYGLLFVLAQYVQHGLHRDALTSALILVSWVLAFAGAGYASRLAPASWTPRLPTLGYSLLAVAFLGAAAGTTITRGLNWTSLLVFAAGGFGTGIGFTALLGHLTRATDAEHAADLSGVTTTTLQVGGALGVTGWGSLYTSSSGDAPTAFAITTFAMALVAAAAAFSAHWATSYRPAAGQVRTTAQAGDSPACACAPRSTTT